MLKGSQRILNYLSASQNSHTNTGQMFKIAILKGERETKPKDTDGNTRGGSDEFKTEGLARRIQDLYIII